MACIGIHFLDTGPLLCLGGLLVEVTDKDAKKRKKAKGTEKKAEPRFLGLLECYDDHMLKDARVVDAVWRELVRHSQRSRCEPGSYGHGGPSERVAAQKALNRYSDSLLAKRNLRHASSGVSLVRIQDDLRRRSQTRAGKRGVAHGPSNIGEAHTIQAILDSAESPVSLVSNDNGAIQEACARNISTCTFVDLMCQLTKLDKSLKKSRVLGALLHVRRQGLDIGKYVTNVMDLPC